MYAENVTDAEAPLPLGKPYVLQPLEPAYCPDSVAVTVVTHVPVHTFKQLSDATHCNGPHPGGKLVGCGFCHAGTLLGNCNGDRLIGSSIVTQFPGVITPVLYEDVPNQLELKVTVASPGSVPLLHTTACILPLKPFVVLQPLTALVGNIPNCEK